MAEVRFAEMRKGVPSLIVHNYNFSRKKGRENSPMWSLLGKCKIWLDDGTFDRSLNFFYQLYTIHGYIDGHNIPLAYFPLPDKKETTYIEMFKFLQEMSPVEHITQPDCILIDFESAAHNAARTVLKCDTKGCKFHHSQSLNKHIQSCPTLRNVYNEPSVKDANGFFVQNEERDWLVRFFGLSCVPSEFVEDAFQEIFDVKPSSCGQEYGIFSDYVLDTYILSKQ
ncbi:hypothetical protein FOCC_FOCC002258 [Frankliniella occidentalis]|nr:hypothetical protein FOCC_FOCC002258 [Frankliniella occidentalis]